MWALGEDRFRITAPGHEQIVTGFDESERAADALAEQFELGAAPVPCTKPSVEVQLDGVIIAQKLHDGSPYSKRASMRANPPTVLSRAITSNCTKLVAESEVATAPSTLTAPMADAPLSKLVPDT